MKKLAVKRKHNSHRSVPSYQTRHASRRKIDLYDRLESLKDSLALMSANIKENTSDTLSQAKDKTAYIKKDVGTYIAKKPYKSLGIIMIAGVCIGYFMHK